MGSVLEKYLFLLGSQRGYAFTPEGIGGWLRERSKSSRRTLSGFTSKGRIQVALGNTQIVGAVGPARVWLHE